MWFFVCFAVGSPLLNGKIRVLRRGIAPFAAPPTAFWISFASNVSPVERRKVLVFFVPMCLRLGILFAIHCLRMRLGILFAIHRLICVWGFCLQFMV
jgi:hypothetical protein